MCPICASTFAWLVLGGGSASGLALLIGITRKGTENGDHREDAPNRHA
jgi:hypothetical protein